MSLSGRALEALNDLRAVASIGADELKRAGDRACQRLARRSVGRQISFSFEEMAEDGTFLEPVALAFELAAVEGLEEPSSPAGTNQEFRQQTGAVSFRARDIRRLLPAPGRHSIACISCCSSPPLPIAAIGGRISGACIANWVRR